MPTEPLDEAFGICTGCERKSWVEDCVGTQCGMPQPDGTACGGIFIEYQPWPKPVDRPPASDDVVQVLMTEEMARRFEARCLGRGNTVGDTKLAGPLLFREDDLPTYLIAAGDGARNPRAREPVDG